MKITNDTVKNKTTIKECFEQMMKLDGYSFDDKTDCNFTDDDLKYQWDYDMKWFVHPITKECWPWPNGYRIWVGKTMYCASYDMKNSCCCIDKTEEK
jgi:hypothetical protein